MMKLIELQWLESYPSLKEALQKALACSGQQLKKYYSSKDLAREVRSRDVSKVPLDLINHLLINPVYAGPATEILGQTDSYLVVHKPAGVHSHPHAYSDQDTLLNFLAQEGEWQALAVNAGSFDRGLLFRLDYETSGLMLVAKTEGYLQKVRENFNQTMKNKLYLTIVEGDFDREGSWQHFLKGSGAKGSKQKVSETPMREADVGELEVKKLLFTEGKSLLLVNLRSGLRHQIRAQLSHLGFPILGDTLYGGSQAERLFLHAWRYEWEGEVAEDSRADLFERFFDLHRGLQMGHDVIRVFKRR